MNTIGSLSLLHSLTLLSLVIVSPSALFREPPYLFSCRRQFVVTTSETKKKKKVIVLGYDRFSLAPSFLQQFLTLLSLSLSLSCNSFSIRTILRIFALVQLSLAISGDCVGNEKEKEGDCDFWTYWFQQEPPHIGTRKALQRRNRLCQLHPGNMHIQTNILFSLFLCYCITYEVAVVLVGF